MSSIRFDGRVAIVTGAGSLLGRRYAQMLAARGALVVVNDADASDAIGVAKEIEERGGAAIPNSDALDTPQGAQAVIEAAITSFGGVDILVLQSDRTSDAGSAQAVLSDTDPVELLGGLFGGYWLSHSGLDPHARAALRAHRVVVRVGLPLSSTTWRKATRSPAWDSSG